MKNEKDDEIIQVSNIFKRLMEDLENSGGSRDEELINDAREDIENIELATKYEERALRQLDEIAEGIDDIREYNYRVLGKR